MTENGWLELKGIPGPSTNKRKTNTPEKNFTNDNRNVVNHEAAIPSVVVRTASISAGDAKANKKQQMDGRNVNKTSKEQYQERMQDILRRKMHDSWLDTSYQRAIWNARRRLVNGEVLEDLPEHEKHLISSLVSPRVKPDYSKWSYPGHKQLFGLKLPPLEINKSNSGKQASAKNLPEGFLPEHFMQAFQLQQTTRETESGLQLYPIEFLSLSDRLTLHEPPWLASLRYGRESSGYDQFGLCYGCFHRKGPHYHYDAPIRTGGGYTIYRRHSLLPLDEAPAQVKFDTARWVVLGDQESGSTLLDKEVRDATLGDDFTTRLFHAFLDNGGDPDALKEYLESNFDPEVLKDLQMMGINVRLISEYAELLRRHMRDKMNLNIEKQSGIVKEYDRDMELMKRFIEITNAGGDLDMLLALLKDGRNSDEILSFEKQGGNLELLEHYASKVLSEFAGINDSKFEKCEDDNYSSEQKGRKAVLVERLRLYIEKEIDHRHANILLDYMSRGGRLDVLMEYVEKGASSPAILHFESNKGNLNLVREYSEKFPNKATLLRDIEKFIKYYLRSYTSAELLQKYIENGGIVRVLKQYVKDGCTFSSNIVQGYLREGGNARLLQDIGDEFAKDQIIKEDLEQFPDDPRVVEAYIRKGGNFPRLVRAIADTMGDPLIEEYVKRKTDAAVNDLKTIKKARQNQKLDTQLSRSASGLLQTNFNNSSGIESSHTRRTRSDSRGGSRHSPEPPVKLSDNLLPKLLETARAELKYDKLMATNEVLRQNEGAFLAKTVDINREMLPVTSVSLTRGERNLPLSIYQSSESKDSSTVSLLTGKRRPKLWKAPPPFLIKKSHLDPTYPELPFSQNREYNISSLSEDHILNIEKRQRHELDVMRRNYNSKDFNDNWKVSVQSPEGSVISEQDSTTLTEFEQTKPVSLVKKADLPEKKKNDRASRRERQRRKMKAIKHGADEDARSASPARHRSSSSASLSIPETQRKEPAARMPSKDMFSSKDINFSSSEYDREAINRITSSRSRSSSIGSRVELDSATIGNRNSMISKDFNIDVSSVTIPVSTASLAEKASSEFEDKRTPSSSTESVKHIIESSRPTVPPLPIIPDMVNDDDDVASPLYATAFGKSPRTPRAKVPVLQQMIANPETQMSSTANSKSPVDVDKLEEKLQSRRQSKIRPAQKRAMSIKELLHIDDDIPGSAVDDVLKKYCIIREDRLPRYRLIFDKHMMLKELRLRERAMKIQRANNSMKEDIYEDFMEESYAPGPAHRNLHKSLFLLRILNEKIDDTENEIVVAKGCLDRATALTAREILFKNQPELLLTPRRRKKTKTPRVKAKLDHENTDEHFATDVMENTVTAMSIDNDYQYDQSARISSQKAVGSGTPKSDHVKPETSKMITPPTGDPNIPLEELTDAQILNKLNAKYRREILNDSVVRHNKAALSVLQRKLEQMKERLKKLEEHVEKQKIEAENESKAQEDEKQKREKFTRQQSMIYQALHPLDDPVLSIDDVPDALRDINGEISRADSGVIFEALDFPRNGDGVNFRVFCILAALSESAVSIQPLVRRLTKTRDARALNVKIGKCKEIYGSLLGPDVESLQSELRSSGFTSPQYHQVMKKLTRDEDGLSFLDFVTYVPLFLDIHQKIVSNPLKA